MYTKPLVLTLLMITSALAGCIEDLDVDSDTTDDIIVDDRSITATGDVIYAADVGIGRDRAGTNLDDCNSNGGTWIEASERGGESYCDVDALDVQRIVCESVEGTWIWFETDWTEDSGTREHWVIPGRHNPRGHAPHSHSHSHGDTTHTHAHQHGGVCDTDNPEVLEELKIHCEAMSGNWTDSEITIIFENSTAEQNRSNDTRDKFSLSAFYRCVAEEPEISADECERRGGTWFEERSLCYFEEDREDDREITQEDCERRNGTWVEASDRSREPYCDFGENDRDDTDEDREITQEDCERRNGTWTEASDREGEFYCDFGDNDTPCDENMTCGDAVTCVDGFLYPSTCGDRNCDEPIGRCGAYASIIIVLSSWNSQHPNYSGLNDIFNSTQPIEIFGYLDENRNMEEATNEEARNYAEQYGINFSFTPLVGNEHGINSSDIEELPYYAASFSMSCDNIIENQIYDDFNGSYNAVIDFIDTWIDCTRSNGSEDNQETESQSQRECEERGGTWVEERRECNDEENQ